MGSSWSKNAFDHRLTLSAVIWLPSIVARCGTDTFRTLTPSACARAAADSALLYSGVGTPVSTMQARDTGTWARKSLPTPMGRSRELCEIGVVLGSNGMLWSAKSPGGKRPETSHLPSERERYNAAARPSALQAGDAISQACSRIATRSFLKRYLPRTSIVLSSMMLCPMLV